LLSSGDKEVKVDVDTPALRAAFQAVLEYMYTGNTELIDEDNIQNVMTLASRFGIDGLKEVPPL